MKVFATLSTLLGVSSATPLVQIQSDGTNGIRMHQHTKNSVMKPSMDMYMDRPMSRLGSSDMGMDMHPQMTNMRHVYKGSQDIVLNMLKNQMSPNMMNQAMSSDMRGRDQAFGPNQYFKKDDLGNYIYKYDDQFTEKEEEGNLHGDVKGQYAYTMPNGIKRQVAYLANNNGFHVKDNADPARIKRSVKPDLIQSRLTSVMDSSSLRNNDVTNMYRMSNMMGRDMSSNMIGMLDRLSNMMGQNSMKQKMMNQNRMSQGDLERNVMGRNIYSIMSNQGMNQDDMRSRNMIGQNKNSQMMMSNMVGRQNMIPNRMYGGMIGRTMETSNNRLLSNNMMKRPEMSSEMTSRMESNDGLMGQRLMQKMEMEHVPETYTSTGYF